MSDVVIHAEALGKRYSLRHQAKQGLFRDRIVSLLKAPFRRGGAARGAAAKEEFWALRGIDFAIKRGDVVGVVGRNGAGKSTLLKILSRITEPTTGRVTIEGRIASLLEVGTGFHGELSGRENIFLNGAILGMTRAEIRRKFDEIVAFSEVEKFLDTPVKHYSSGMYVRLAFAVAAHLEPEILIVDEVLAVGDAAFQKKCLGKLRDVSQGEGRTVLFVSHNLSAIRQLCTSAILLSSGRLVAFDRTSPILDLYAQGTTRQEKSSVATPSPDLIDRAYVTGATVETLDGNSPVVFPVGVPWCVKLSFRVVRPMTDFVAAIGITMNDGTAVQTAWAPPRCLDSGDYVAVFTADRAILAVGSYLLSAGLTEKEQSIQQLEIGRLEIGADGATGYFQMVAGVGLILNSMAIEIRPATP